MNAKASKFSKAIKDLNRGKISSVQKCAAFYSIPYSKIYRLQTAGTDYKGSGQYSKVLSLNEEAEIIQHEKWRASIGCGVD